MYVFILFSQQIFRKSCDQTSSLVNLHAPKSGPFDNPGDAALTALIVLESIQNIYLPKFLSQHDAFVNCFSYIVGARLMSLVLRLLEFIGTTDGLF